MKIHQITFRPFCYGNLKAAKKNRSVQIDYGMIPLTCDKTEGVHISAHRQGN